MFPWVVHLKCIPTWTSEGCSAMPMLERQLTEVIKDNYRIIPIFLTINMISVYKFCVIGGIFLTWFADSMLFSMMVKTEFTDGVETPQDLIDRDMTLGI